MQPISILLSGYYGFDNAGDEAICGAIIAELKALHTQLEITVLSAQPEKTKSLHQVEAISRTHLPTIWQKLKQADLFISGGGSLLQDQTSRKTIPYYLGLIKLAQWCKVPVAIFSQGIGPVRSPLFQRWIIKTFQLAEYVSVRDKSSKQLLIQWGLKEERIQLAADPVLLFDKELFTGDSDDQLLAGNTSISGNPSLASNPSLSSLPKGTSLTILRSKPSWSSESSLTSLPNWSSHDKKPILLSIRRWPNQEQDLDELAKVADQLLMEGEEVLFLPLHYPDDVHISEQVQKRMKKKAMLIKEQLNPYQILSIISRSKLLIGMRLHALIFAAVLHIPSIAISYDPKIDAFMQQLGEKATARAGEVDNRIILDRVNEIYQNYETIREQLVKQTNTLKQQAKLPLLAIEKIL